MKRSSKRRRSRRGPAYILVMGAWLLAASGASCRAAPNGNPNVIVVAMATFPANLDPRVATDAASQNAHQLLFDTLLGLDEHLRVVPGLALRWEMPDDRTYVVHLRRGVPFHDGHELTAADVTYTFGSFLDPKFISARRGAYRMLSAVRALDRYTVEFRLSEPFGSFPTNLVMPIVPVDAGSTVRDRPIGTGPYQFVSASSDDRLVLKAFPGYYRGRPRNDGLILKVVPDDTMRGLELRKGTVDLVVNDLAPDIVHELRTERRLQLVTAPGTDYAYLGFNLRDPILRDVRVRQAVGFAIDREAIVRYLLRGLATPAIGILPPISWAFEPEVFSFDHDPARARALLDAAGHSDPDGDGPQSRFRLVLKISTAEISRLQSATIQQDLRKVGVDLEVRSYEFATLYTDVLRGNFQMFTLQWVGVSDPDILRRIFHSQQVPPVGFNRGYYHDPTVDHLLDRAARSTDDQERRRLYAEAQRIIAKAAPYVSLWYKTNVAVMQPSVSGVKLLPAADFTFLREVSRTSADVRPAASAKASAVRHSVSEGESVPQGRITSVRLAGAE